MRALILAGGVLLALGIAGCGAARHNPATVSTTAAMLPSTSAPTTTTTVPVNYANQYLADIEPANAALAAFQKQYGNADEVTATQAAVFAQSNIDFGRLLLSQTWPANAVADIHALAAAEELVGTDLRGGLNASNVAEFTQDANRSSADAQVVRADLGLPPVQT